MKSGNDNSASEKTYRIIIDRLRQDIESARYKLGSKLPSEKELCSIFGASRSSVREALRALEYIGLIEVQSGSGYYVTGNAVSSDEELISHSATKMAVTIDSAWTIRSIRQLLEQGADATVIAITGDNKSEWLKQLRAVRQAARDVCSAVPVIANIKGGIDEQIIASMIAGVLKAKVDIICVSADKDERDILTTRELIDSLDCTNTLLFARLDSYKEQLHHYVRIADGLVMDSQFLLDAPHEMITDIIGKCHFNGKLIMLSWREDLIVAGDQPEHLIDRAVTGGFDGVILRTSGSAQKFPRNLLAKFKQLARQAEEEAIRHGEHHIGRVVASPMADALCLAAIHAARAMRAAAFVVPTSTGFTPRLLSKFRQNVPIIAVSANDVIVRQLHLVRGVQPLLSRRTLCQEDSIELAVNTALSSNLLREGDAVTALCSNLDVASAHSTVQLLVVGNLVLKGQGIGNGIITGRVAMVKGIYDINKRVKDKIVVITATDAGHIRMIEEAAGLIVEEGGLSSHAAIACLSLGKPVIVGATDATDVLIEDEQITMDVMRGLVYQGWVNLG